MITEFSLGPGTFPAIGWAGTDWYTLFQQSSPDFYRVHRNGVLLLSAAVTPGTLAFPKLLGVSAVLRDGSDGLRWPDIRQPFATTKQVLTTGVSGNDPMAQNAAYVAWQTGGSFSVQRQPQAGGATTAMGAGRPTGLSRILSSGAIVLVDDDRTYRLNGQVFGTRPAFSGGALAVEHPSGGVRVWYGSELTVWPGEDTFTPQIALGATAIAVATWGAVGVRVAIITLDEFSGTPPAEPPGTPSGSFGPVLTSPAAGSTPTQKLEDAAKLVGARTPRAVYPHLKQIKDADAQAATRILYDRIFQVEQLISGAGGVTSQIAAAQAQAASVQQTVATQLQQLSVASTGTSVALGGAFPSGGGGSTPGTGGGGGSGGGGGGGGQSGNCAGAPGSGHIPAGDLTFTRMAQIICGTATEWSQYLVATADLATRQANAENLILRMIWHLQQGGFNAGRQQNPSTAISKDKLACVILTETRAFDVFSDYDNFRQALRVGVTEVFPAVLVASAGISD